MPDAPTPLDLEALRALVADLDAAFDAPDDGRTLVTEHPTLTLLAHVAAQVPALLAEVERLRAEVRLAKASAHSASLALGSHLAARPAPAWDEEAARGALVDAHLASVRQVMEDGYPSIFVRSNEDAADAALAVVRDHLPVKPSREDVADVLDECGTWCGMADVSHEYGPCPACVERCMGDAHAVLDLWPGRSEAEVKAEALREFADTRGVNVGDDDDEWWRGYRQAQRECLHDASARADRLAAEGGADRG